MSVFDLPRIHLAGTVTLDPGTANNDDYAGSAFIPPGAPRGAGETLALMLSSPVRAQTYGMTDAEFVTWVQTVQTFNVPDAAGSGGKLRQLPAEWNYYGAMAWKDDDLTVVGVQVKAGEVITTANSAVPLSSALGAQLELRGTFTDVNSEGSPPATQFFLDTFRLQSGTKVFLSGTPDKAAGYWLNFYRNVNLTADAGAGSNAQHALRYGPGTTVDLPGFRGDDVVGVVFRYSLFNSHGAEVDPNKIASLYAQRKSNPTTLQIVATIAPLLASEVITSMPVGRLMTQDTPNVPTNSTHNNGVVSDSAAGNLFALAPAVARVCHDRVTLDLSATFPDEYDGASGTNNKFNIGDVLLVARGSNGDVPLGTIGYLDTVAGNASGWIFDVDISNNAAAQSALAAGAGLALTVGARTVLSETDAMVATNGIGFYTQESDEGSATLVWNQGSYAPFTVEVYQRGKRLDAATCPNISVWIYRSVPMQNPGDRILLKNDLEPGQPISVPTRAPGNTAYAFTVGTLPPPALSYSQFMNPPYVTNWPNCSHRVLPNADYKEFYVDPTAAEPVGNDQLTWDIVYNEVLRVYYLLYPVMNEHIDLSCESAVAASAQQIIDYTSPAIWLSSSYMPRTRDMSDSHRTLLQAWCRKQLASPQR